MQDGMRQENLHVTNLSSTGSITVEAISGTTIYGTTIQGANSTIGGQITQTFGVGSGTIISNLKAEAIISGGMWVVGSVASGTTLNYVAKPAPLSTDQPLGICLGTTASGAYPNILIQGLYNGLIAEDTISNGTGISMGSGAALNCVAVAAAGTTRGTAILGAGSEAACSVYLW